MPVPPNSRFYNLYQRMFAAKQSGDVQLAEELMIEIDRFRRQISPPPSREQVQDLWHRLPSFVRETLDQDHHKLGWMDRSNCINAAFNFHDPTPRYKPYSSMELLERLQTNFVQINNSEEGDWGDLIVAWSRSGGSWDHRPINVHEMSPSDSDFPYGLVFDHVVVRLGNADLVFHKPDPTLESRYLIDFLDSAIMPTVNNKGFELTCHRRIDLTVTI